MHLSAVVSQMEDAVRPYEKSYCDVIFRASNETTNILKLKAVLENQWLNMELN